MIQLLKLFLETFAPPQSPEVDLGEGGRGVDGEEIEEAS